MSNNKIQILPQQVANQIAAGEVVTRPADVVKELVENSIDSGATEIAVVIVDSGKTSIQVIDNGCGMSREDAVVAFQRHATSKIRRVEDLFTLGTMGFRGEALPSIASVAQVSMETRQMGDDLGIKLEIEGDKTEEHLCAGGRVGTSIKVDNLFYNVRARRAFLGTDCQEKSHIIKAFTRIALVYTNVAFSLTFNGKTMFRLAPSTTRQRIADIFGKEMMEDMLPVNTETTLGSIRGFVGKPKAAHKKNVQQYLFVNGRYIDHAGFRSAIATAYERMIPKGEKVPFFICLQVDPKDIDVNVHPNKTEVKFSEERAMWQGIHAAVVRSLGSIDMHEQPVKTAVPVVVTKDGNEAMPVVETMPAEGGCDAVMALPLDNVTGNERQRVGETSFLDDKTFAELADNAEADRQQTIPTDNAFQFQGAYIITPISEGLMVIDQERAHERVLYERYRSRFEANMHASQLLMFHDTVSFPKGDADRLPEIIEDLESVGFDFSDLGGCTYAINAVPAGIEGTDVKRLVTDLVNNVLACSHKKASAEIWSDFAMTIARKMAIAHGEYLAHKDIVSLLTDLNSCSNNQYSPSGKAICRIIPQKQIVSLFCA